MRSPSRSTPTALVIPLAVALLCALPASAQDEAAQQEEPDVAAMEAELEQAWAAALAMGDEVQALWRVQAVSMLLMQEMMLERARALAAGVAEEDLPTHTAARDRVIARWRRERPGDAIPELLPTFEMQMPEERIAATLPLLDRYPDDPVLIEMVDMLLRQNGQAARAGELLEGYLARHAERPGAWRMLANHYGAVGNETRRADVVARWVQRDPLDAEAVAQWLALPAAQQDPATTASLVDRFFAARPSGAGALQTCVELARRNAAWRDEAHACVARVAASDDGTAATKATAQQAGNALVSFAVEGGDWDGLLAALDRLPEEARWRALRSAVHSVPVPEGCDTRVQLLRIAAEAAPAGSAGEDLAHSTAGALRECAARPAARAVYLELLRSAAEPIGVVWGWVTRVQGRGWLGELPPEAAGILESRLASAAQPAAIFAALDVVYQVAGDLEGHADLLRRWERRHPDEFPADQALALAEYLVTNDRIEDAITLLQRQVARPGWSGRPAEGLWELHHQAGHPERAARLTADLLASEEEERVNTGRLLAGREAARAGDTGAAERHFMALLASFPSAAAASELMGIVAPDPARATAVARRICDETRFGEGRGDGGCAANLLGEAGLTEAAAAAAAQAAQAEGSPDLATLRDLASKAQAAGDLELAERTRRQVVDLDPKSVDDRVALAVLLERRGKLAELEALVAEARRDFPQPPREVLRAAGRAFAAGGKARRGIELLREARADMEPGYGADWVDAELREAYVALGREGRAAARPAPTADALEERRRAADAGDADAAFDVAAATLTMENSGEPCRHGLALLERAAGAGHARAAGFLGRLLYYGRGRCVEPDPARAIEWLRAAIGAGEPDALYDLGLALLMGGLGEAAQQEGVALIAKAVADKAGHRIGAETLHLVYASGFGAVRDVTKARHFAAEAARLGSDGLPILGSEAERFPVLAELLAAAAARLEPLAASGDAPAAGLLGRMVDHGWGVPRDRERALRLIRAGAEGGDGGAMRQLAWAYEHGDGVAKDGSEAVRWWRRGAEAGDSFCMMFLSHALREGRLVAPDPAAALAWMERSARAGNYWAVSSLGRWHAEGWAGSARDERKAAEWKRRLAALGDEEARGWLAYHGYSADE